MSTEPSDSLEVVIGRLLRRRALRLAIAESCTGGLIGHRITNVPGSSDYYLGSVTAYAYEAKEQLLAVRHDTLVEYGAVSEETVREMARGVRQALGAELGAAVSGIAGPGGGMPEKPVGLVWIGLSAPGVEKSWRCQFSGDRLQIKEQTAERALQVLVDYLRQGPEELLMEPVTVTARFDLQGKIIPLKLTWQGREYAVDSTGRRWQDDAGMHMLVMVVPEQVFELLFVPFEGRWYLKRSKAPATIGLERGFV